MMKKAVVLGLPLILFGCKSPRAEMDAVIQKKHFIPFELPMPSTRVGTVLRGNSQEMYLVATPERCFPDLPAGQELRWTQATDLPKEYKKISADFKTDINAVLKGGNTLIDFKSDVSYVKTVEIELRGVSVELLDEAAFADYYSTGMSDQCKRLLGQHAFIGQGLRVEGLSFVFKDQLGATIDLNADLDKIVKIAAGAHWQIENNYTLVISTPKYIGYRMARLVNGPGGPQLNYASTVDSDGNWLFKNVNQLGLVQFANPEGREVAEPLQ